MKGLQNSEQARPEVVGHRDPVRSPGLPQGVSQQTIQLGRHFAGPWVHGRRNQHRTSDAARETAGKIRDDLCTKGVSNEDGSTDLPGHSQAQSVRQLGEW